MGRQGAQVCATCPGHSCCAALRALGEAPTSVGSVSQMPEMHTRLSITLYTVDTARTHRRKTHPHRDHKGLAVDRDPSLDTTSQN